MFLFISFLFRHSRYDRVINTFLTSILPASDRQQRTQSCHITATAPEAAPQHKITIVIRNHTDEALSVQ